MFKTIMYKISSRYRERVEEQFYDKKSKWMERVIGKEHDMVFHAIFPYEIGGPVDVYIYPKKGFGTTLGTKEMVSWGSQECLPFDGQYYEVAMVTKHDVSNDENSPFSKAMIRFRKLMTMAARYSGQAVLKSLDTVEMPTGEEGEETACAVFYEINRKSRSFIDGIPFTVQYIIEVHPSEMLYARNHGTEKLITLMKEKGVFPFSDLDRNPVV